MISLLQCGSVLLEVVDRGVKTVGGGKELLVVRVAVIENIR